MTSNRKTGRSRKSKRRCPSLEKIENGLFIDFEGFGKNRNGVPKPAMCGYRIGSAGPVTQAIFSRDFKWAASEWGLEVRERKEFIAWLLNDLKKSRSLFAFSEHEDGMIRRITGRKKKLRKYENVLAIAKEGLKGMLPEDCKNTLIEYCNLTGITVPDEYGKGQVTEWMRGVKAHSKTRKAWESAPTEAREQWRLLLDHNRFDVESMYELLIRIKDKDALGG